MTIGDSKISFKEETLLQLIKEKNIEAVKEYVSQYFIKLSSNNSAMWVPSEDMFEIYDDPKLKSRYIQKLTIPVYNNNGKKIDSWVLQQWYFSLENPSYRPCTKINKPRIFIGEANTRYFNLMPKSLFGVDPKKKIGDFSNDIQRAVEKIWDHINIVWCSRKKDQFEYVQKWLSHVINGRKMKTALYMCTMEGVGKGIIIEFLRDKVLGRGLVYQTSDAGILGGRFNGPLVGKVLFILEEAPCATLSEWKTLDSKLKNFITESVISIEKKGIDQFDIDNTVSFIINSNHSAIRVDPGNRRIVQTDVSSEKKGNTKYFDDLANIMDQEGVAEAFYWNCIEIAENNKNFKEQDRPVTDAFRKNVSDNANSLYSFIKEEFVLKRKGINTKSSAFYLSYIKYCTDKKIHTVFKKASAIDKIKEIGIPYLQKSTKHHNQNWILCEKDDLLKIFKMKNLIHETDDFECHAHTPNPENMEFAEDKDLIGIEESENSSLNLNLTPNIVEESLKSDIISSKLHVSNDWIKLLALNNWADEKAKERKIKIEREMVFIEFNDILFILKKWDNFEDRNIIEYGGVIQKFGKLLENSELTTDQKDQLVCLFDRIKFKSIPVPKIRKISLNLDEIDFIDENDSEKLESLPKSGSKINIITDKILLAFD